MHVCSQSILIDGKGSVSRGCNMNDSSAQMPSTAASPNTLGNATACVAQCRCEHACWQPSAAACCVRRGVAHLAMLCLREQVPAWSSRQLAAVCSGLPLRMRCPASVLPDDTRVLMGERSSTCSWTGAVWVCWPATGSAMLRATLVETLLVVTAWWLRTACSVCVVYLALQLCATLIIPTLVHPLSCAYLACIVDLCRGTN